MCRARFFKWHRFISRPFVAVEVDAVKPPVALAAIIDQTRQDLPFADYHHPLEALPSVEPAAWEIEPELVAQEPKEEPQLDPEELELVYSPVRPD